MTKRAVAAFVVGYVFFGTAQSMYWSTPGSAVVAMILAILVFAGLEKIDRDYLR